MNRPVRYLLALLAALSLLAAACGEDGGGTDVGEEGEPGSGGDESQELISETYDYSDLSVHVGTKDFTEMLVLGEIARLALEAAGADVRYTENLPSPAGPRDALLAGEIDLHWEYTGTAWINYLGNDEPIEDPMEQFEAVKRDDLEENGIYWMTPAPFDDTYGIAYRNSAREEFGIETISDLAQFVTENPDQATLCLDATFGSRDDGLPGLEEAYDFTWPQDTQYVSDFGVIYTSTAEGDPCNFGEIFTTDGRIAALDLYVIEDDKDYFISYLSSVNVREDLAEEYPDMEDMFARIGENMTEDRVIEMNAAVDVDGEFPADVAEQYLREEGLIE